MRFATTLILFALLFSPPAQADKFRLKSGDKQTHMLAGYGLSLTGTLLLEKKVGLPRWQSVLYASAFTMLVGTAKEFMVDKKYSAGDQWANLIGTAGSAAMVFTFEF
jgi:hypothetical protein